MKKILLYYPPNNRSVPIETLAKAVVEAGHQMILLTLTERGPIHEAMERMGIETYTTVIPRKPSWKFHLKQARYLVSFSKKHRIDTVWIHLQEANIIGIIAQYFMKAKVIAFRHHTESALYAEFAKEFNLVRNKNEARADKVINRFASTIVVPSSAVWSAMEKYEGVNMKKVVLAPYMYEFSTYAEPDKVLIQQMRRDHPCRLMLIMVSRMIPTKQHMPVFEVLQKLIGEGFSIKMMVLDGGELLPQLEAFIREHKLEEDILMVGFKTNFVDYMAGADLLMHPSLTEASSNVVKEMGMLNRAVAVCEGVGDFDDYIREGINGYVLRRKYLKADIEKTIRHAYDHPEHLPVIGAQLHKDVVRLFADTKENRERFLKLI